MLAVTNACSTWSLHSDDVKLMTQTRSVERMYSSRTIPPYGKKATVLSGYSPSFAPKPVQIKIEYARPLLVSAKVIGCQTHCESLAISESSADERECMPTELNLRL